MVCCHILGSRRAVHTCIQLSGHCDLESRPPFKENGLSSVFKQRSINVLLAMSITMTYA